MDEDNNHSVRDISPYAAVAAVALVLLAALMVATTAQAQIALPLLPCMDIVTPRPVTTALRPAGLPPQYGGTCSLPIIESNATGAAAAYWCATPPPASPALYLYAVRWSAVTVPMLADFALLGLPGDNAERIRAMRAKYQTENVWDMCDVWEPMRERINAAMPAPAPARPWTVAKYSLQTTRPAYPVLNGVRGTTSTSRAPVGATCDCTAPLREGLTTYCPFTGSGTSVAICTQP